MSDILEITPLDRVFGKFAAGSSGLIPGSGDYRELERLAEAASAAVSAGGVYLALTPEDEKIAGKLSSMPEAEMILSCGGKSLLNLKKNKLYLHCFHEYLKHTAGKLARLDWKIISGGPGTGKTTLAKQLIAAETAVCPALKIRCAAPNGKAKERLTESLSGLFTTDGSALAGETIHMMLGYSPARRGLFRHNRDNPLSVDLLLVDEMSMVPLKLFAQLLDALPDGCKLYLLGDPFQLSAVEPGAVFAELCRIFPDKVTELTVNHRFPANSPLGIAASAIRNGNLDEARMRIISSDSDDFRFRPLPRKSELEHRLRNKLYSPVIELEDGRHAFAELSGIFRDGVDDKKIELAFQLAERFKILAPAASGNYGTEALNHLVMKLLDFPEYSSPGMGLMATVNDYRNGIFNGDQGICIGDGKIAFRPAPAGMATDSIPAEKTAQFRIFRLPDLTGLTGAFAITIHKSQGSGFQNVLLLPGEVNSPLLSREMIYTGLTRTIKNIEIWGSPEAVELSLRRGGLPEENALEDFISRS